jgi:hypothetical protein
MKGIEEMTLEDIEMIEYVYKLKSAGGKEIQMIRHIMQNYIDDKFHVCSTCHAQVRLAHARLKGFFDVHRTQIEDLRYEMLNPKKKRNGNKSKT